MRRWLTPYAIEGSSNEESAAKEASSSVLWGGDSLAVHPGGNYPTLSTITFSCLRSEPPRVDLWLGILEEHTARAESPSVWEAMIQRELLLLHMAGRSRAESFMDKLIASMPSLVDKRGWTLFIAKAYTWASSPAAKRWLMIIIERNGKEFRGVGELIGLRHALYPAEDWPRELVNELVGSCSSAAALGIAHSVANLWQEPMTRPVVHPILLQLLHSNDGSVLNALSAVFLNGGFSADMETTELLEAIMVHPNVLKNGRSERLPEMLVKLVEVEPELVCKVAHVLVDVAGDQMGSISTSWYLSTDWLLDIALHLQDMGPAQRAAGSALFERMLEFNMPQAREMSLDLDKRTPTGAGVRAPIRRRSRRKLQKVA